MKAQAAERGANKQNMCANAVPRQCRLKGGQFGASSNQYHMYTTRICSPSHLPNFMEATQRHPKNLNLTA